MGWWKNLEQVGCQILLELRFPLIAGLIWAIIRLFLPGKHLQFISDFFLAVVFINFCVASYYRIARHERLERSLADLGTNMSGVISDATTKTENRLALFVEQFQEATKMTPALRVFAPNITSLSSDLGAQIRQIRSANNAVSAASSTISGAATKRAKVNSISI